MMLAQNYLLFGKNDNNDKISFINRIVEEQGGRVVRLSSLEEMSKFVDRRDTNPVVLIIEDKSLCNNTYFDFFIYNGRCVNKTLIMNMDDFIYLPPPIRANLDYVYSF